IHGVSDSDDLMIMHNLVIIIRSRVADLRVIGRTTQGVRLIKINDGDAISSVAKIDVEEKDEAEEAVLDQSELSPEESLNAADRIDPEVDEDLTDEDTISEN